MTNFYLLIPYKTKRLTLMHHDNDDLLSFQVSLDGQARETINKNMLKPTIHAFDEAQIQIYMLMQRDSYPRFLNSQIFLRLLEQ